MKFAYDNTSKVLRTYRSRSSVHGVIPKLRNINRSSQKEVAYSNLAPISISSQMKYKKKEIDSLWAILIKSTIYDSFWSIFKAAAIVRSWIFLRLEKWKKEKKNIFFHKSRRKKSFLGIVQKRGFVSHEGGAPVRWCITRNEESKNFFYIYWIGTHDRGRDTHEKENNKKTIKKRF